MKKYTLLLLAILTTTIAMQAQYGNSWIDFSKTYYKFQLDETGIYRIPTSVLNTTGLSLVGDDFQLFYKGQEIPIYVTTPGTFGASDYIEFYGEENDGEFDTQLFETPDKQLQTKSSLFTDESTYFLTTNVGTNKRFESLANDLTNVPAKEEYFLHESCAVQENNFHFGEPYYTAGAYSFFSTFDEGEGFCGPIIRNTYNEFDTNGDGVPDVIQENTGLNYQVFTDNVYQAAPEQAHVTARVVGRNSSTAVNFDKHLAIGIVPPGSIDTTVYVQDSFKKFQVQQFDFNVGLDHLETIPDNTGRARTKVNFRAYDGVKYGWAFQTRYSVALLKMTYPRDFDFNNEEYFEFNLDVDQTTYIEIENFDGGGNNVLYDLTEGQKYIPVVAGGVYKIKIEPTSTTRREFVIFKSGGANTHIQNITQLTPRNFVDYDDPANRGQYLIITHESLRGGTVDQIERYENYRESAQGGSYDVVVADIDELYDQFSWGIEKHPMAIKNFISYAYNNFPNSVKPAFVNIIGKGVRYEKTRFDNVAFDVCLVPSYGYTATDLMFTTANTQDYLPQLAIGRIPAKTPDEVRAYLDKVLEYEAWITDTKTCETIEDREWMKKTIHIAKGWGSNETNNFQSNLDVYKGVIEGEKLGYKVVEEFQDLTGSIPSGQTNNYQPVPGIKARMDAGLSLITFVGHSSPQENYWQFDMQFPTYYENEGKYPFILSNSCFVGKINDFYDKTCMAEDYTITDDRGSIGFLGAVALSSPSFLHLFSENFVENIAQDHYSESIGENVKNTISDIYNAHDDGVRIVSNEFILAGDPAIKLYQWDEPEFSLTNSTINVSPTGVIDATTTNQLTFDLDISNLGQATNGMVDVVISQYRPSGVLVNQVTQSINIPPCIENYTFTMPIAPDSYNGLNSFIFEIDGNNIYPEDCEDNNEAFVLVEINSITECDDFEVFDAVVCSPPDISGGSQYQVLIVMSGGNPGANGYLITNDQTGETFGPIAGPSITFGPFDDETGYSYTVSVVDNPTCSITVNQPIVSCGNSEACYLSIPMDYAGWHIISSYCEPANDSIEVVFNPIVDDIIQVKNLTGQVYIPSFNNFNNGLDFWDIESGYLVKTAQPTTLDIIGDYGPLLIGDDIPLYSGWNLIAYWLQEDADPIDVFSDIASDVIQVKNLNGSYVPSFNDFNNMGNMLPTNGYYVKMNADNNLSYFGTNLAPRSTNNSNNVKERLKNTHFIKEIKPNPNSSTLIVLDDENNPLNAGDELGVFTSTGILVGAFVYENAMMGGLVFGDDETEDGIDGIQADEKYIFKVWDKSSNEERLVEMDFVQGKDTYLMHDLCAVSFKNESTTGINSISEENISVYPNPASSVVYFNIKNGNASNVTIEIYDAKGQLVDIQVKASILQNNEIKYDVNHLKAGIYTYQIKSDLEVYNGKFSVAR